ncbi:MAG: shikimate dehydrogenase [Alphaproteobacteria bacterium]|nr:shikimate dehydrogenase [Alphaproteobacteria bacterium]
MYPTAFVIGQPIGHSRSPLIHSHWLKSLGLTGSYRPFEVAPAELEGFLASVRNGAFAGGNITLPHKQAALRVCDGVDDSARTIGAVNTVVVQHGKLLGSNTDLYGFLANLDQNAPGWDASPDPANVLGAAIVLGAGGAARAVVVGLIERRFDPIIILNRTPARAHALAEEFSVGRAGAKIGTQISTQAGTKGGSKILGGGLDQFGDFCANAALVVNTSSVGMDGTRFGHLALNRLPQNTVVTDIVYTPLETGLLADAKALGLTTVDGLGMLLHQAVPGFNAWFGVRPEVTPALRRLVVADLQDNGGGHR